MLHHVTPPVKQTGVVTVFCEEILSKNGREARQGFLWVLNCPEPRRLHRNRSAPIPTGEGSSVHTETASSVHTETGSFAHTETRSFAHTHTHTDTSGNQIENMHFPCYLQHFGAGNCHFHGICHSFEREPFIFHGICSILVVEITIFHGIFKLITIHLGLG